MFTKTQLAAAVDFYVDALFSEKPSIRLFSEEQAMVFAASRDPSVTRQLLVEQQMNEEAVSNYTAFARSLKPAQIALFKFELFNNLAPLLDAPAHGVFRTDKCEERFLKFSAGKSGLMSDAHQLVKKAIDQALDDSGMTEALAAYTSKMKADAAERRVTFAPYETPFPSFRVDMYEDGSITYNNGTTGFNDYVPYAGGPEKAPLAITEVSYAGLQSDAEIYIQSSTVHYYKRLTPDSTFLAVNQGKSGDKIELKEMFAGAQEVYEKYGEWEPDYILMLSRGDDQYCGLSADVDPNLIDTDRPEILAALQSRHHADVAESDDLANFYLSRGFRRAANSTEDAGIVEQIPVRYVRLTQSIVSGIGKDRFHAKVGDWVGIVYNGIGDLKFERYSHEAMIKAAAAGNIRLSDKQGRQTSLESKLS